MSRWWSRLFGPSERPLDEATARAASVASEYIDAANQSLRAACASLDCDERESHEEVAWMALGRLKILCVLHPALKLTSLSEFEADLNMVRAATKARRREEWRKQKNMP